MFGVAKGFKQCNNGRLQVLNDRIYDRNLPSEEITQQFDPRPSRTRQVLFPALDCNMPSNTPIKRDERSFNTSQQFTPGSSGPFSGWATQIDSDSTLKSLYRTTQKWTPQNSYIPGSQSDMFRDNANVKHMPNKYTEQIMGSHSLLFNRFESNQVERFSCSNIGIDRFNNHTRQQLKNTNNR